MTTSRAGRTVILIAVALLTGAVPAPAQTPTPLVPVGEPITQAGLRVALGYLPTAVSLDSGGRLPDGALALHLQLDVDAARGNPYGLDSDDSVPYLRLPFTLTQDGTGRRLDGTLEPMVSRDGFHYGANVVVAGPGTYSLAVEIRPPEGLARHTDARTGVLPWWAPFTLTWSFRYPP
ncbi:MAG TPA: iron transporter [Methylomirabilota bacterium]|jgi:hypothetical protein|nr:iron transporter [Methylomirabilota bacterium]